MNEITKHEPAAAVPAPQDAMAAVIERIALDPNIPIDRLERMLDMQERVTAKQQRQAYFEAMADAQAKMAPVARDAYNKHTKSSFATLAAIYSACKPIAASHGLSFSTNPVRSDRADCMGVNWVVRHREGHVEEGTADVPIDGAGFKGNANKTDIQAFGSTATYARRYLFCMIFDVATADDNDGNTQQVVDTVSEEQFRQLRDMLEQSGADPVKFYTAFGHSDPQNARLEEFPAARFAEAMGMLRKRVEQNNA